MTRDLSGRRDLTVVLNHLPSLLSPFPSSSFTLSFPPSFLLSPSLTDERDRFPHLVLFGLTLNHYRVRRVFTTVGSGVIRLGKRTECRRSSPLASYGCRRSSRLGPIELDSGRGLTTISERRGSSL